MYGNSIKSIQREQKKLIYGNKYLHFIKTMTSGFGA